MYVIDVIPLSRTAPGTLSYRSAENLVVGTIVSILVRKTQTQGIVVQSIPVLDAKEMLKHAHFLLSRSVPAPSGKLPDFVLRAAQKTADFHAATLGAVLVSLFSEHLRSGIKLNVESMESGVGFKKVTCELPLLERINRYDDAIRQTERSGRATLLIAPTLPEVAFWKTRLKSHKPIVLTGAIPPARRAKAVQDAIGSQGLIIATPSFAWLPIERLGLVVLDRVSAGTYVLPKRPYIAVPYACEALVRERACTLLVGDFPLPIEDRTQDASLRTLSPTFLYDARRPKDDPAKAEEPWLAVPVPVLARIQDELKDGGRSVVLAARKGYAPSVVCRDCGQAQTDERGMAYSFSLAGGTRIFRTSDGNTIEASRACQRCGSWNLLPLGVGIERVEEELSKALPGTSVTLVAPELLTSPRKVRTALDAWIPGSVLVGTEALLPWLYDTPATKERKPLGVIASADSLLAQPFWRARERFVRLAYFLNGLCKEVQLVTRRPEDTAVDATIHPDSLAFWEEERMLRKALRYPPYGTLITIVADGTQTKVRSYVETLLRGLEAYRPSELPARRLEGGAWRITVVLNLPTGKWPDAELGAYLRALPPTMRIRINPESLW